MCRRQGADSCGVRCENICSTRVYLDLPAPLMLTPFYTLGNMCPETQGYVDLTVNLLLSVTNFHIDKLDLAFWEQRFRNFQKGREMGPCDSVQYRRKRSSSSRGFPMDVNMMPLGEYLNVPCRREGASVRPSSFRQATVMPALHGMGRGGKSV